MRGFIVTGLLLLLCLTVEAAGTATHVVLIVWDGMRPDFISEQNTPTLFEMSRHGVSFAHHHPVYISSTEVNGTALATGVYPSQSTILANAEFRPAINPHTFVEMQDLKTIRRGDETSGGHYLNIPTVGEILHAHGLRTAIAGSKPIALLHDRSERADGALGMMLFAGETLPADLKAQLVSALGPFPAAKGTKINCDQWTTSALTQEFWKDGVPPYSLLWLAEPDYSQHRDGPGAPNPMIGIKNSDEQLRRVLRALKEKNALDSTDVIVVSDHGFSTVLKIVDIMPELQKAGLPVATNYPSATPTKGDILMVSDGGVVLFYFSGHGQQQIEKTVHRLQTQPSSGVIFTKEAMAGTFALADAHLDSPFAPDIAVVMRWTGGTNQYGAPGMMYCDRAYWLPNKGSHGTLCPTEMHNTGVAFGPDFKNGMTDPLPTGNIDIAPTILWILGVEPKQKMSGRVLTEALTIPGPAVGPAHTRHREVSEKRDGFVWRQYLDISEVNGVEYIDEGNGAQEPASAQARN